MANDRKNPSTNDRKNHNATQAQQIEEARKQREELEQAPPLSGGEQLTAAPEIVSSPAVQSSGPAPVLRSPDDPMEGVEQLLDVAAHIDAMRAEGFEFQRFVELAPPTPGEDGRLRYSRIKGVVEELNEIMVRADPDPRNPNAPTSRAVPVLVLRTAPGVRVELIAAYEINRAAIAALSQHGPGCVELDIVRGADTQLQGGRRVTRYMISRRLTKLGEQRAERLLSAGS